MDQRGEEHAAGAVQGKHHYQIRQRLLTFGDDYWIEDDRGNRVFKVDGKALRIRKTLRFRMPTATSCAGCRSACFASRTSLEIEGSARRAAGDGRMRALLAAADRMSVQIKGGADLEVKGNILGHEYSIGEGRDRVAEVSKALVAASAIPTALRSSRAGRRPDPGANRLYRTAGQAGLSAAARMGSSCDEHTPVPRHTLPPRPLRAHLSRHELTVNQRLRACYNDLGGQSVCVHSCRTSYIDRARTVTHRPA